MLKANVGISRKLSKDFQSTGFTVNIEGELTAAVTDPDGVIDQIKELYDVAEEALDQQIDRSRSVDAIGSRDEQRQRPAPADNGRTENVAAGHQNGSANDEEATTKQINFLLSISKRQRLSTAKLEAKIADVLGYQVGLYDLSKREAGVVLDAFTKNGKEAASTRF